MLKKFSWTPERIRQLRGKRTQQQFATLIRVPKNTVWRWEAGYSRPDAERARRLAALAKREKFLRDWRLAGSAVLLGDIEEGSKILAKQFKLRMPRSRNAWRQRQCRSMWRILIRWCGIPQKKQLPLITKDEVITRSKIVDITWW